MKLVISFLFIWIFIPTSSVVSQTATPESNYRALRSQSSRMDRLEDKADHITEVMTSIKYLDEKIVSVAETQNFIILSVLGALSLNLFNTFKGKASRGA